METKRFALMAIALALAGGFGMPGSEVRAHEPPRWSVNTWPGGIVYYRYATDKDDDWQGNDAVVVDETTNLRTRIRLQMTAWEDALEQPDPADQTRILR